MNWRDSVLWRDLAAMRIEPEDAELTFAARLARENRWARAHAEAVIEEYRRFLYLAATSVRAVTPSEDVDQAWHLHLAYSRHYWAVLCGRILGRPLHHGPTEGGAAEDARFHEQYEATLAAYRETFGEAPPVSVWPPAAERFAARPVRIDTGRFWVVPKAIGGRAALGAGAALLAACSAYASVGNGDSTGTIVGWLIFAAFLAFAIITSIASRGGKRGKRSSRSTDSGCGSGGGDSWSSSDSSDSSSGCGGGGCGGGGD